MITGNKIFKKAVKIVSLTIGLTAGLVLLAKFWLDGRYDRWMTDSDRVYAIVSKYSEGEGEEPTLGSNVSGGVAPLLKTYSPDVEVASRLTLTGWGRLPKLPCRMNTGSIFSIRTYWPATRSRF